MVTSTTQIIPTLPEYAQQPTVDMAATLQKLLGQQLNVPGQQVAGFQQPQIDAMNLAMQGIGAYKPFLQAAQDTQAAALGTTGAGVQALGQMNFDPSAAQAFHVTFKMLKHLLEQQINKDYNKVKCSGNLVEQQAA
jgi:hypothetical protein